MNLSSTYMEGRTLRLARRRVFQGSQLNFC